jgi:hypothetical protein
MDFPAIHGPSDPEEYSWEVTLGPGEQLKSVDGQHAEVYYEDGTVAFVITVEPAHDAVGAAVPTSLGVSEGDVITLVVHHRAGNPAAGGAPFVYPVVAGEGGQNGTGTVVVTGPPDEEQVREEHERAAREEREAQPRTGQAVERGCVVPRLTGDSLKVSRRMLRAAGCTIGRLRKRRNATAATGKVIRQSPRPGAVLPRAASIELTLGN